MLYHLHLHCIIPGGALSFKGDKWNNSKPAGTMYIERPELSISIKQALKKDSFKNKNSFNSFNFCISYPFMMKDKNYNVSIYKQQSIDLKTYSLDSQNLYFKGNIYSLGVSFATMLTSNCFIGLNLSIYNSISLNWFKHE